MLEKWISDTTITLRDSVDDWQQALAICARPLLQAGLIKPEYMTAIIQQHKKLGPWYVLAPGLAMPHARPEEGVNAPRLSLLKLQQGVAFGSEECDPVDVIIMLCAVDKHSHITMLTALAELFSSDQALEKLHQASTREEIINIIAQF